MSDVTPPPPGTPPTSYPSAPGPAAAQNGLGVTALVMGILQFVCLGPIGSILAIVFGILGRNKAKQGLANNKGVATAGLVLGIVGLVISIITAVVLFFVVGWGVAKVAETVDLANNSKTGLADGSYVMEPNSYLSVNDRCAFSGPVADLATGAAFDSVTVVGEGAAQCGSLETTPDAVDFTVSGGVAAITGVTE